MANGSSSADKLYVDKPEKIKKRKLEQVVGRYQLSSK
jgi:hypothetical protein